jgi:hypothetical protein
MSNELAHSIVQAAHHLHRSSTQKEIAIIRALCVHYADGSIVATKFVITSPTISNLALSSSGMVGSGSGGSGSGERRRTGPAMIGANTTITTTNAMAAIALGDDQQHDNNNNTNVNISTVTSDASATTSSPSFLSFELAYNHLSKLGFQELPWEEATHWLGMLIPISKRDCKPIMILSRPI